MDYPQRKPKQSMNVTYHWGLTFSLYMGLNERRHFVYRRHRHKTVANGAVQCTSMLREKLHHTGFNWIGLIQVDWTCFFCPFDGLVWSDLVWSVLVWSDLLGVPSSWDVYYEANWLQESVVDWYMHETSVTGKIHTRCKSVIFKCATNRKI